MIITELYYLWIQKTMEMPQEVEITLSLIPGEWILFEEWQNVDREEDEDAEEGSGGEEKAGEPSEDTRERDRDLEDWRRRRLAEDD